MGNEEEGPVEEPPGESGCNDERLAREAGDEHFVSTRLPQGLQGGHLALSSHGAGPKGKEGGAETHAASTVRQEQLGFKPRSIPARRPPKIFLHSLKASPQKAIVAGVESAKWGLLHIGI